MERITTIDPPPKVYRQDITLDIEAIMPNFATNGAEKRNHVALETPEDIFSIPEGTYGTLQPHPTGIGNSASIFPSMSLLLHRPDSFKTASWASHQRPC